MAFRATNAPNGRVGETLSPPPAELKELQKRKDEASEEAIDRLCGVLGDDVFARVDQYVQKQVVPNVTVNNLNRTGPVNRAVPIPTNQRNLDTTTGAEDRGVQK